MIKIRFSQLEPFRNKLQGLSRQQKIVALVFGGVIVSGMIFVFAELGGYGVNGPNTAPNSLNYGLVGYWDMEEGSGQVIKDKSGNGNDGTLGANSSAGTDDPVFAPGHDASGPNGTGLSFDGINDYATINATNDLSGGFSESFWFYRRSDAIQGLTNISTASGQYRVFFSGTVLEFDKVPGELGNVTGTTALNQWTHAVVTHDGTTASVYINGALVNQAVADFGLGTTTAIYVGSFVGGYYLDGAMDDLRIYNRAISADEVRLLYNQKKPILDLKFDEGSGTVAHDESFNNYDGTINGATWVAGKNGGALSFDGINDDVSFSSYVFNGCEKEYTKSAWIKTDNISARNVMSGDGSQHVLYLASGQIQMSNTWDSSVVIANANYYDNNWHHIEVTYKNNIGKIYFDGKYLTEGSLSDVPANSAFYVGAFGAANNFDGYIDNLRIYNYARTADEVLADYNDNQAAHLGSNNSMGYYGDKNNYAWKYRKTITIDHTKVSLTDQTNFPMLVSFTDPLLKTVANGGRVTNANGYDIIFTDTSGTQKFDYEIEKYVPTTGEIVMWVKIPVLSASIDTSIYIYYGNAAIVTTQENKTGVWDDGGVNNFKMVQHMNQNPGGTAPQMKDSTQYANNGTSNGTMTAANSVTGQVDGATSFDGVDDYMNAGNGVSLNIANEITISGWVKLDSVNKWQTIIAKGEEGVYQLRISSSNQVYLKIYDSGGVSREYAAGSLSQGVWYYVSGVFDGSNLKIYLNNNNFSKAFVASDIGVSNINVSSGARLNGTSPSQLFNGSLDEVRISNTARSADWIATEYNNQNTPSAFYALGNEQMNLSPILQYKFDEGSGAIAYNAGFGDYLSSWQYRKSIVVTNQVASSLTGYQVKLIVDTASLYSTGKMKIDGSDLRFTDTSGNNIPYWIESGINTSSTIIWIKTDLASSETKTVYMYYGNSWASAASSGSSVFDFFDDFSVASLDMSVKWQGGVGYSTSNGELVLSSTWSRAWISSKASFSSPYTLMYRGKIVSEAHNINLACGIHKNSNLSALGFSTGYLVSNMDTYNSSGFALYKRDDSSWNLLANPSGFTPSIGTYYISEIKAETTGISSTVYSDNMASVLQTASTTDTTYQSGYIELGAEAEAVSGTAQSNYDWVAIRQYATTEPSSGAWSAEEKTPNSDLTFVNSPTWVTGKFGTALNLTAASSQYGYTLDNVSISLTGNLTMSAWIKPTSVTASTLFDIAGKWDGANESYLLAQYGNQIRMYIDSSSSYKTTTVANLTAGNWYHVEAVYTAASQTVDIYVNGVWQAGTVTGTISASIGDDAGRFQIGAEDSTTTAANLYDGVIDDFKLYSYARTADKVLVDYNDGQAAHLGKNNQDFNRGLVGYWNMEEGSGQTIYDKSGNGNNGTLGDSSASGTDDPVFSAGHDSSGLVGAGLLGDGGTDYVNVGVGTNMALTNLGAISLWIKPNSLTQDDFANFVTRRTNATGGTYANYSYSFHWRGLDSTIRMAISDGVTMIYTSIPMLTDTNWHHLVGMWNGSFLTIYKDGILASTPTAQTVNSQAGAALSTTLLGNCFSTSATNRGEFNGTIDEVRMYNRALSNDEISTLYNQKKPVLEMKFDEGSGTIVHDESFNNKDGTLGGGTAAYMPVWTQGKFGSALSLDGSNDYVDISDALPIYSSTAYSISLWVKGASGQADMRLFSQGASANSLPVLTIGTGQLGTTGKLDVFFRDENGVVYLNHVESDGEAFDGNWHYVVWTDAAGSAKMYIDGIPSGSFTYAPPASVFAYNRAALGAEYRSTLSGFFVGSIDEVRVYNYTRTPAEVLTDYNNGQAAHLR